MAQAGPEKRGAIPVSRRANPADLKIVRQRMSPLCIVFMEAIVPRGCWTAPTRPACAPLYLPYLFENFMGHGERMRHRFFRRNVLKELSKGIKSQRLTRFPVPVVLQFLLAIAVTIDV